MLVQVVLSKRVSNREAERDERKANDTRDWMETKEEGRKRDTRQMQRYSRLRNVNRNVESTYTLESSGSIRKDRADKGADKSGTREKRRSNTPYVHRSRGEQSAASLQYLTNSLARRTWIKFPSLPFEVGNREKPGCLSRATCSCRVEIFKIES